MAHAQRGIAVYDTGIHLETIAAGVLDGEVLPELVGALHGDWTTATSHHAPTMGLAGREGRS